VDGFILKNEIPFRMRHTHAVARVEAKTPTELFVGFSDHGGIRLIVVIVIVIAVVFILVIIIVWISRRGRVAFDG
jgi:hypothetical protein